MRVKVFRHHLILLLLLADFGKAVVLLWYPARVLGVPSAYDNINFCDVVGFFTSVFIEGADFAVLSLAIHTALIVFTRYSGPEGGLYPYRYWVYGTHILLPLVMAALVFVTYGRESYIPLVTWCYLPIHPRWARFVLSWGPRYVILISIIFIYLAIYIYVKLEYSKVVKEFKKSQTYINDPSPYASDDISMAELTGHDFTADILGSSSPEMHPKKTQEIVAVTDHPNGLSSLENQSPHQQSQLKQKFSKMSAECVRSLLAFFSYFPGFGFLTPNRYLSNSVDTSGEDATTAAIRDFQRESMANFQMRRNAIERQIRSIFVYPAAYCFLWMAPFAVHILQYKAKSDHHGVFWINCFAAFMQPFNCSVDTVAFCIREKPWIDRKEKIFTIENKEYLQYQLSRALPFVSCPPSYQAAKNIYDNQYGSQTHVDGNHSNIYMNHSRYGSEINHNLANSVSSLNGNKTILETHTNIQKARLGLYDNEETAHTQTGDINFNPNTTAINTKATPTKSPRDERQASTSSDLSNSTDATYPPSAKVAPPPVVKLNSARPHSFSPPHSRAHHQKDSSINSVLSDMSTVSHSKLPHSLSLTGLDQITSEYTQHVNLSAASLQGSGRLPSTSRGRRGPPLAPPVPSLPIDRSISPFGSRSNSPSRRAQKVVQKRAAQAAQKEYLRSSSERERSPVAIKSVFNARNRNTPMSPLANVNNKISADRSRPSVDRRKIDDEAFQSTTAQRVEIGKKNKKNQPAKGFDDDNEDEGEIDLLEFLR